MCMVIIVSASHQAAHLVWREVGNNLVGRTKRVGYMFDVMGTHNACHNLTIDRQGDIHPALLYHRRPMLVAQGVPQLDGYMHSRLYGLLQECTKIDDHNVAHTQSHDNHLALVGTVADNIAIREARVTA